MHTMFSLKILKVFPNDSIFYAAVNTVRVCVLMYGQRLISLLTSMCNMLISQPVLRQTKIIVIYFILYVQYISFAFISTSKNRLHASRFYPNIHVINIIILRYYSSMFVLLMYKILLP